MIRFVVGGWNGERCLSDVFQYCIESSIWFEILLVVGTKPEPRYRLEGAYKGDSLIIFGGVSTNKARFNDLFEFNFEQKEWTQLEVSGSIPTSRSFHRLCIVNSIIFLFGGLDGERKNDLYAIQIDSGKEIFRGREKGHKENELGVPERVRSTLW